ncbi:MAG: lipid-A-disaccharide synthase, partial [Bdellovibrio sp.]
RMSTWTYWFAKAFIRGVRHFSLPNLILGREVIPERWQKMANEERLTQDLRDILDRSEYRQEMIRNLQGIEALLGDRGASRRVADALEEYFLESKLL